MTTDAKVGVANRQHFWIDGAVGIVAGGATFAHGRMFKNHRPGLFPMTLRARFVQPGHRQTARRFHDVLTVRIVALNTIHFAF